MKIDISKDQAILLVSILDFQIKTCRPEIECELTAIKN